MSYLNDSLITADLHLTDRKNDEYRWEIFDCLVDTINKRKIKYLFILGDLTDKKDAHQASLVHRIVRSFAKLALTPVEKIYVLKGNHDYTEQTEPFFGFLTYLPKVVFISDVMGLEIGGSNCLFLPHTPTPKEDWKDLKMNDHDYIFCHQCFAGARAVNGHELDGAKIKTKRVVFAGDIHEPQKVGRVRYVGSPYPITFVDDFEPRMLYLKDEKIKSIKRKTISKKTIRIDSAEAYNTVKGNKGDQIKIVVTLPKSEFSIWDNLKEKIKEHCIKNGIDLKALELRAAQDKRNKDKKTRNKKVVGTPKQVYDDFCKKEKLSKATIKAGSEFL